MMTAITVVLTVVPSIGLFLYFYKSDLHPEPRGVLLKTFVLGVLSIVAAWLVAFPLMFAIKGIILHPLLYGLFVAFVCAALPEEAVKFLVLTRYSIRTSAYDEPMDAIVYGATASLGFATLENILYVTAGGIGTAVLRAVSAVPLHACVGAIMGYYVGQARLRDRGVFMWLGYLFAVSIHGLYDFPLYARRGFLVLGTDSQSVFTRIPLHLGGAMLVLLVSIIWVVVLVRKLRQEQRVNRAR